MECRSLRCAEGRVLGNTPCRCSSLDQNVGVNETRSTRQGQRDKIDDDEHEDDDRSPDGFVELSNQAEPGAEMRVSCAES